MSDDRPGRTLRIALAMRGGVSLAVWIGGAVAELDLFRRACSGGEGYIGAPNARRQERAEIYSRLLREAGYDSVDMDILAGASAGGLNAVLFGLAQSCDVIMDDTVHETWLRDGGIWELLREPGFGRVQSILKGDDRFFTVVRDALAKIATSAVSGTGRPPRPGPSRNVCIELAATLLDDPRHPNRRNRARFSFAKSPGLLEGCYSTIPGPLDADTREPGDRPRREDDDDPAWRWEMAIDRLALAARATSSFPGAFEPAEIYSSSSGTAKPGKSAPSAADYLKPSRLGVNMSRVFLYAARCSEPFHVVDGGIFDNIPIDRAIRAIHRASAVESTDRCLVYLDPDPPIDPDPVAEAPPKNSVVSWLPVIRSSVSLKQRTESADDELALVREHNDRVLHTRGQLEALAAMMRTVRRGGDAVLRARVDDLVGNDSYQQCRIATDAVRIANLVTAPWAELCYPPREAVDYCALPPAQAVEIKTQVLRAYNDGSRWNLESDIHAMLDWTAVLIAWVRALEDLLRDFGLAPPGDTGADVPQAFAAPEGRRQLRLTLAKYKPALYRWLHLLIEAKHRSFDEVLAHPLRTENYRRNDSYPLVTLLRESRDAQAALTLTPALEELLSIRQLRRNDADVSDERFYRLLSAEGQFSYPGTQRLAITAQDALKGIADEIRDASLQLVTPLYDYAEAFRTAAAPRTPDWLAYWAESVYPHLYLPPLNGQPIERLAKIFAVTGVPDTAQYIRFDTITGSEPPRLELPTLEKASCAAYLDSWLRKPPSPERMLRVVENRGALSSDAKLAGSVLSNFGGFLRWRWRENDWQWGRLDAAAGIARILLKRTDFITGDDPQPGNPDPQQKFDDNALRQYGALLGEVPALQESILRESAELEATLSGQATAGDEEAIVTTVGGEGLHTITPHYRFALTSRIVPLLCRAAWPATGSALSVGGAAARVANLAVRPLAVWLPLLADPLRMALAVSTILLASALLGSTPAEAGNPSWPTALGVALVALGVLVGLRANQARRRWRDVTAKLTRIDREFGQLEVKKDWIDVFLTKPPARRYRLGCWTLAVVSVVLGAAIVAQRLPAVGVGTGHATVAIIAAVLGLQHWLNQRSYRVTSGVARPRRVWRRWLLWGVAAVLTVATVAAPSVAKHVPWWTWLPAPAVAGVAVAVLTAGSVWGWVRNRWAWTCLVGSGILGAAIQFAAPSVKVPLFVAGLLPALVWTIGMVAVVQVLPYRRNDYGEDTLADSIAPASA